jgi:hypothetical protein
MYHLWHLVMIFAFMANVVAQEETLLKSDIKSGGFGGPVVKFTSINDQGAVMIGGRGGWIINHSLVLGGGAYAVVNEINAPEGVMPFEELPLDIEFGYGGFELEYIIHPMSLIHFSVYTLIGGAATNYVKDVGPVTESNEQAGETDFMFILEPAANAELNVTSWFRLNAGVSYRLVTGVGQVGLTESDFNGMTGTITFKFGKF